MLPVSSNASNNNPSKRDSQAHESKRKAEQPSFQKIFKSLSSQIDENMLIDLRQQLKNINDELIQSFEQIQNILIQKQKQLSQENKKFENSLSSALSDFQQDIDEMLQTNLQMGEQNMQNWKLLQDKKDNYEIMHHNLLEMKRKNVEFSFSTRFNR